MSPMYFLVPLVSFNIVSKVLDPQPLGTPPHVAVKEKVMFNLMPLVFLACIFLTLLLNCVLAFYCSLLNSHLFVCPHLSSFLVLSGCVFVVDKA